MTRLSRAAMLAVVWGAPALAGPIGYAQATGYFKDDTRPTLYQPLNLLDARENTAWCSPTSDPLNEVLTFGFKDSSRIDEVRVYTGNGFSEQTFQEFSRAKKFSLKGPLAGQTFTIADQRGQQAVPLNPPLVGAQFTLEVLDQFPAEDPDMPVCITDVVFYSDGKALNGAWLAPKLKFDKQRAPYLGTWFAGYEGAPDKYLSFFFDGSYRYHFDPFDKRQEKEKVLTGAYQISGTRLTVEVPGKGRVSASLRADPRGKGKAGRSLGIEGDVPPELKQKFRSVR